MLLFDFRINDVNAIMFMIMLLVADTLQAQLVIILRLLLLRSFMALRMNSISHLCLFQVILLSEGVAADIAAPTFVPMDFGRSNVEIVAGVEPVTVVLIPADAVWTLYPTLDRQTKLW